MWQNLCFCGFESGSQVLYQYEWKWLFFHLIADTPGRGAVISRFAWDFLPCHLLRTQVLNVRKLLTKARLFL